MLSGGEMIRSEAIWKGVPLDSRQLRAFVALAHTGGFTAAGRELYLSQSAISHSMRALEEDIGCRLFDRVGKKVMLTMAGEQLLAMAERILGDMGEARMSMERLGKWGLGRLRVGASTTACTYLLPGALRRLKEGFPGCRITVVPADTAGILGLLQDGKVDLGLTLEPKPEEAMVFEPLFTDQLCFMTAPQHAWAVAGTVDRREVATQNYILYHRDSYTFRLVDEYFRRERLVLNTVLEVGSMEAIKELVKLDLGVSVLAPWIARAELLEGSLVVLPLGRRKLERTWGVVRGRARPLTLVEETLVRMCREEAGSRVREGMEAAERGRTFVGGKEEVAA
jgi:DNA-binding transcriptional LysR family regulator